jgi:diguanylate cyclase (GGDEF)-like protein
LFGLVYNVSNNRHQLIPVKTIMAYLFALLMLIFSQVVSSADDTVRTIDTSADAVVAGLALTDEEQKWLAEHKTIRIAYDGSLPPYSFVNDEGKIDGVAVEIIGLLSQRLGVRFTTYPDYNWTSLYKAAAKRKADVVATMVNRPDRTVWFGFTKPYLTKSLVIVTKADDLSINKRGDLDGKNVAVVKGYQYADQLIKEFPSAKLLKVDSMLDGLKSVSSGQTDAAIIFLGTVNYLQAKYALENLRIAAFYDRNNANESIAVRKDWPILLSLMQKGLDSLHEEEVQRIFTKWVIGGTPSNEPLQKAQETKPAPVEEPPPVKAAEPAPVDPIPPPAPEKVPNAPESVDMVTVVGTITVLLGLFFTWVFFLRKQSRPMPKARNEMMTSARNLQSEHNESLHLTIEATAKNPVNAAPASIPTKSEADSNPDAITCHRDCDGRLTLVSSNVSTLLGYSEMDFVHNFRNYLTGNAINRTFDEQPDLILQGQPGQPYEIELVDAGGDMHVLEVTDTPVYNGLGHLTGIDCLMRDVTAQRLYEKIAVKSATASSEASPDYDQLQTLYTQLKSAIHHASQQHQNFILIYILLERFRTIDGEPVDSEMDEVLNEAARRLRATLRDSDEVIHFQANKFALILPDTNAEMMSPLVEKIRKILQVPYLIGIHSIVLDANIGLAVYPKNGNDPADLISEAQILLPQTEGQPSDSASSEGNKPISANSLELQQDLLAALDECKLSMRATGQQNTNVLNRHSQLSVYYQSLHSLGDYSISGFEALIRWRHPQLGLLAPLDFVDLVKDIGMTDVMTYWIVQQVSFQCMLWESQNIRPGFIIVNLSGLIGSHALDMSKIQQIIVDSGADPSWLLFSVPESEITANIEPMIALLNKFTSAGLNIAIDNFGPNADFSSRLPEISAKAIEIDPYFTYDVSDNYSNGEIINHTVAMLQEQGKKVIIKGVETEAQLDFLKSTQCDLLQGHLLSRALPASEAKELMETFPEVAWYFQEK